ncbi:baseplate J/gp47 family protein [Salmonella enterica]|nr:baseplate J/gp47 family protein [Salmonella enterica]
MFQLKNFVSIAASMLNYVRSTTGKVTDLQPGSVTRTILEAPATEIEELYVQMFNGIKEAIPVAVYNSIKFDKLPAQYAAGRVTITATKALTQPLVIPVGTRFLAQDGRAYVSVAEATWPAAQTQYVLPVISSQPGVTQNAAADQITSSPLFPPDRFSLNSTAMINGSDQETDDSRKIRFSEYIASLSRGTEAAMLYAARTATIKDEAGNIIEAVSRAALTSSSGSVKVYIWGSNGAPSVALQNAVYAIELGGRDASGAIIPGYSAAGIRCDVAAMVTRPVDATFTVTMEDGTKPTASVGTSIKIALNARLESILPGQTITAEEMRVTALLIPGVLTAEITGVNNIVCETNQVLTAGNVVVQ